MNTVLLNSLHKMQTVSPLRIYAEHEQGRVEIWWPSGTQDLLTRPFWVRLGRLLALVSFCLNHFGN